MRLFGIESDGGLTPYPRSAFDEGEAIIEDWLEPNPRAILEDDPLLLIGRQVRTDRGKRIDLLGVNRAGSVVVVELKRGRTPRDVVAQALEYAAFAARLDVDDLEKLLRSYENDESLGLADRHGEHFGIRESVAFNKDQRDRDRRPTGGAGGQAGRIVPELEGNRRSLRRVQPVRGTRRRRSSVVDGGRRRR